MSCEHYNMIHIVIATKHVLVLIVAIICANDLQQEYSTAASPKCAEEFGGFVCF